MDPSTMLAFCPSGDFARIEHLVREWSGVEAVGSLRSKEKKKDITNVFVKFTDESALQNAIGLVDTVPGLSLTKAEPEEQAKTKKTTKKKRAKNLAAELINFSACQSERNGRDEHQRRDFDKNQGGRGTRGGRGQRGEKKMMDWGQGGQRRFFVPHVQVSVAFVDNVPFNMTNEQIIEAFSPFGRVLDINRYELMAMVFYDSQEAVLNCIQHLNGKPLRGNIISVSSSSEAVMRATFRYLDQTHGPHKSYKYTYMPDPRKLAPIETTQRSEILPIAIRPPTSYVPNHESFLEKADIHRLKPTSDFKASFKDWKDLMTCDKRQLRVRGIPRMTRIAIRNAVLAFQNGNPPEQYDTKEEWLYYKQFKTIDYSYRVIPELPEKYRPHQSGIDQAPLPDYREINTMPEWARKEEERLGRKSR